MSAAMPTPVPAQLVAYGLRTVSPDAARNPRSARFRRELNNALANTTPRLTVTRSDIRAGLRWLATSGVLPGVAVSNTRGADS